MFTNDLHRQIQRIFEEALGTEQSEEATSQWQPAVDIYENDNEIVLLTEVPGMKESDFKLSLDNNVITISGERKLEVEGRKLSRQERPAGAFKRSFTLPNNIDIETVNAAYSKGVLQVNLPKKPSAKPREIAISVV